MLEHAVLEVGVRRAGEFSAAFTEARPLIEASPGCLGVSLLRCTEDGGRFLLLVRWRRLEDHTEGFRGSPAYQEWRRILHHFYDPFPVVEHYVEVTGGGAAEDAGAHPPGR